MFLKRSLKKVESTQVVMLNPESVILNHALNLVLNIISVLFHGLVQNLFRAGLFQHLGKSRDYETLKSKTLNLIQGMVQGDRKRVFQRPLQKYLTNYLIYVKSNM